MISLIHHPGGNERLGDLLIKNLNNPSWHSFRAAVAFAKRSGVKHLVKALHSFVPGRDVRISVGLDLAGTSVEALIDLLASLQPTGELWIFHNESSARPTFHPKVYLFWNEEKAECFIGSANLTEGGLFTNYEAVTHLSLDLRKPDDDSFFQNLRTLLDTWRDPSPGTSLKVTPQLIEELKATGDLLTEAEINTKTNALQQKTSPTSISVPKKKIFASVQVKAAPHVSTEAKTILVGSAPGSSILPSSFPSSPPAKTGFVITLQNTDVGVGQTSSGTSRRSPELFLPVICVRSNPAFWGWPDLFKPDPKWAGPVDKEGYGKMDREGVRMRMGSQVLIVNWWYNPDKKDYRLRNEALRSSGNVDDILRIELADGTSGFDYYVEVVPQGTSLFQHYAAFCVNPVRNSKKKFGYY